MCSFFSAKNSWFVIMLIYIIEDSSHQISSGYYDNVWYILKITYMYRSVHIYSADITATLMTLMILQGMYIYYHLLLIILLLIFQQVNTDICEQTFSWLSRYACIPKHMNNWHFMFYLIYECDFYNRWI